MANQIALHLADSIGSGATMHEPGQCSGRYMIRDYDRRITKRRYRQNAPVARGS